MISQTDLIETSDGEKMLIRRWPEPAERVADLIVVHGLNEHSGRYEHLGAAFAEAGFRVTSFDLPGHGATGGHRAYIEEFDHYLDVIDRLRPETGPFVLYGHSMGGVIAAKYALDRIPPDVLLLSAPALDAAAPAWQKKLSPLLGRFLPKLPIPVFFDSADLSHDPSVGEAYDADPLVHDKITARLGAELLAAGREVAASADSLTMPTMVIHGGADTMVPARFSAVLGDAPNVTRKLYPKLKHECHNEPEGPEVIQEMVAFVRAAL